MKVIYHIMIYLSFEDMIDTCFFSPNDRLIGIELTIRKQNRGHLNQRQLF